MSAIEDRTLAADMIGEDGQVVTIATDTAGSYNPATGSSTPSTSTKTADAVVLPLSPFRKAQANVAEGDRQLLLSAIDTSGTALAMPAVNSVITLADGSKATLTAIDPLSPAGTVIFFDCIIRMQP